MVEAGLARGGPRLLRKDMEKAAGRTHDGVLSKIAVQHEGRWMMQGAPCALFHPGGAELAAQVFDRLSRAK